LISSSSLKLDLLGRSLEHLIELSNGLQHQDVDRSSLTRASTLPPPLAVTYSGPRVGARLGAWVPGW
jgi:hypothetical protein